jgi:hypothetical protein
MQPDAYIRLMGCTHWPSSLSWLTGRQMRMSLKCFTVLFCQTLHLLLCASRRFCCSRISWRYDRLLHSLDHALLCHRPPMQPPPPRLTNLQYCWPKISINDDWLPSEATHCSLHILPRGNWISTVHTYTELHAELVKFVSDNQRDIRFSGDGDQNNIVQKDDVMRLCNRYVDWSINLRCTSMLDRVYTLAR